MTVPAWWNGVVSEMEAERNKGPGVFPGAAFGVETRSTGVLVGAVGADFTANSIAEIGSMTKPLTATAILLALHEAGKLDPDREAWRLPGLEAWERRAPHNTILLRHLLQHTSGLPWFAPATSQPTADSAPWVGSPGLTNEAILVDGAWRPARQVGLWKVSQYVMETYSPQFTPGKKTQYSNFEFLIAARIVEAITGLSLNHYLKQKVFGPLQMADTFYLASETGNPKLDEGVTAGQRARIPEVVNITPDGRLPQEVAASAGGPANRWNRLRPGWNFVWPEGGAYSTARDLLRFLGMLRNGGVYASPTGNVRVLPAAVVKLLTADNVRGNTLGFAYKAAGNPSGQGAGTIYHLGRFMTYFWLDASRSEPVSGVFLSQRLTNVVVNGNVSAGTAAIDRYVQAVYRGVLGSASSDVAAQAEALGT